MSLSRFNQGNKVRTGILAPPPPPALNRVDRHLDSNPFNALNLTFCHPGGGPKGPQLSKSLNILKYVFKSGQNVFDFVNDDFRKI